MRITVRQLWLTMFLGLGSLLAVVAPASAAAPPGYPVGPAPTVAAQPVTAAPKVVVQSNTGGVAFTGANVLRWSIVALALIVAGTMIVVATRRRRVVA